MSAGSFKQDGLNWRINLIKQRFGEWMEYQTSQLNPNWDLESFQSTLLWQIIKFCLWSMIAVLLVWITWQLWLLLRVYWKRWQKTNDRHPVIIPTHTTQLSAADWVERSQSARIDGNYRQAIFCLYQAMLERLNERGIVPTQLSLTDEEYRRSLLKIPVAPLNPYELLLSTHQRLCFSQAEADRALFEECQQAYQQIEN
ncbi:hypothetical protein C7B62_07495 [Pleurocapsa sp. CCALA 161]|uniref:DUF4129 domain-containing protein n=1 Tax=Pleurocapsa sp. CCALA 161 TaxID=2107688 RepID=UPI000D08158D|nr:DUF4129 domain-containing protein [Pleurocapsa sp. CCALA 161]PSB10962.1 hypothetical protein C7B62_07495 [Pleurocapsa sp. CCALA 161]